MSIPGLLHVPTEESSSSCPAITLTSFSLKPFAVPGSHRFGKSRSVHEFANICVAGQGSFGIVYKVMDKKSNEIYALKSLNISEKAELMPQNFLREITNLKLLKHDNIANLICVAVGDHIESTCLILEFCEYSLSNVIDDVSPVLLQQPQIKSIMYQLFTGLDYIHKHLIFHRDLSPSNILFNHLGILKITDFGSSRKMSSGNVTPNVGLRWYQAPEILFGSVNYTSSVDIWASGCILAEMIRQRGLFIGDSDCDVIKRILDFLGSPTEAIWPGFSNLPVPKNYNLECKPYNKFMSTFGKESAATLSLLQNIIFYNPAKRPSAEECLNHPYFSEHPLACSLEILLQTLKASKIV